VTSYNICGNNLDIIDGNNGITVSGGADSALLLYFLLKYSTTTVHIFTIANLSKLNTNTKASVNVISKCAELTNNYNFIQHVIYSPTQNPDILFKTPNQYHADNIVDTVYSGITANPPSDVVLSGESTEDEQRNPNVTRSPYMRHNYLPWTNIDKRAIAEMYRECDLMESLYPLTRSCEWKTIHSPKIPNPHSGHCGECWWCTERQWGFGRLS